MAQILARTLPQLFVSTETEGFVTPRTLTQAERSDWLKRIDEEDGLEIPYRGRVYIDEQNANFWRIEPGSLQEVVDRVNSDIKAGLPPSSVFNHIGDVEFVVGRATRAVLDGNSIIFEGVLTDPDAQRKFIRQEIDRFSIGLRSYASAYCSVCGPVEGLADQGGFSYFKCDHYRGDRIEDGQNVKVVEAFLTFCQIGEHSWVVHPAVEGTVVLSVDSGAQKTREVDMSDRHLAQLAELEAIRAERDAMKAERDALNLSATQQKEALLGASEALFGALFDAAIGSKVLEHDRAVCRAFYDASGPDALKAYLAGRQPVVGLSRETIGSQSPVPASYKGPEVSVEEKGLTLAQDAYRLGKLSRKPTVTTLENTRFASTFRRI